MSSNGPAMALVQGGSSKESSPQTTAVVLHAGVKGGLQLERDIEKHTVAFLEVADSLHKNAASIFELIQEAFDNASSYSGEERSEIVDMARQQFDDLYKTATTFMAESTVNRLEKEKVISTMHHKAFKDQAQLHMTREQHLCNTITLRDNHMMALQNTISHMTLQTGLLRGEIHTYRADNILLTRKVDEGAKATKALQTLTTDMAAKISDLEEEKLNMAKRMQKQLEEAMKSMTHKLSSEKGMRKQVEQRVFQLESENKRLREMVQLKSSCPTVDENSLRANAGTSGAEPQSSLTSNDASVVTKLAKIEPLKKKLAALQQEIDDIMGNE